MLAARRTRHTNTHAQLTYIILFTSTAVNTVAMLARWHSHVDGATSAAIV